MKLRNLPTWLKGGIIANIIQIIFYIAGITTFLFALGFKLTQNSPIIGILLLPLVWLMLIALLPTGIMIELKMISAGNDFGFIFSIIIYFLFGALIGWILGRMKSKKKN